MTRYRTSLLFLVLAVLCLIVALGAYKPLTALMSLHMLVQIPLLILAGLFAEQAARPHLQLSTSEASHSQRRSWSFNEYGVPGLLLVSLVGAAWMIPKALDDALVDWRVAAFKYVGLPVCGWILGASARNAPLVIKLFFLGNFSWMSAIVGMIYLDQPVRLCNAYLLNDQEWAGRGLIILAIGLPLAWIVVEKLTGAAKAHRKARNITVGLSSTD